MGYKDLLELQAIKSNNAKADYIKNHSDDEWFKRCLYYIANPVITYNISEKTLNKYIENVILSVENVTKLSHWKEENNIKCRFDLLDFLSSKKGVDNDTIEKVALYLNLMAKEERDVFVQIIAKTFRIGIKEKGINKVIPGLIPEFSVQQAYPIDKYPIKEGTEFWLTQKLNGVRCTAHKATLYARSGSPYTGLNHILNVLEGYMDDYVFDGELTLKNPGNLTDNEAFRKSTGIINSDAISKPEIKYTIFDIVPIKDFENDNSELKYSKRRELLDKMATEISSDCVHFLPVLYHGKDLSKIDEYLEQMVKEDKEGLMLNLDVPYKRNRHRGILKVKRFYTIDLEIKALEEGSGKLKGTLGAFVVDYKGNELRVGTGMTDEQRAEFWSKREDLIGEICEVKYKEISSDKKTGEKSLQFPVFISLRPDKTSVNLEG